MLFRDPDGNLISFSTQSPDRLPSAEVLPAAGRRIFRFPIKKKP
jgi:hypothetical protein